MLVHRLLSFEAFLSRQRQSEWRNGRRMSSLVAILSLSPLSLIDRGICSEDENSPFYPLSLFYLIEVSKADIESTQTDTFLFFFRPLLSSPLRVEKLCQRIRANAFVYTHISRKRRDTHTHAYLTNMLVIRLNLSFVNRYPSAAWRWKARTLPGEFDQKID